jgi:DNA-directed RNA polymerase III subunit RPC3
MEVTAALSRSVNVSRGIGKEVVPGENLSGDAKGKKRRGVVVESDDSDDDNPFKPTTNGDDQDSDTLMDDDEFRPAKRPRVTFQDQLPTPGASEDIESRALQVKKHLQILAEDECRFIRKTGTRGQGEWTVDFDQVVHFMKEAEIDAMMLENFGTHGHRLARMMRKMGRLEEKQLPNLVLIKHKDIRTKLAEMQMAGVVDIQEVPRDANRTNNRTIFLWYFEAERVATILLDSIYKAMSRCYQRLDVEKRKSQDVISLTERSDVRDLPPEEYLDAGQVNELERFRAKEQKILGEVARLDELVGTFRDY